MATYVIRRLLQSLIVIFGVTIISFSLIFLTGDPTYLLLGDVRGMTREEISAFRHQMGFDRPLLVQYFDYMSKAIRGDLGKSYYHGIPNIDLIAQHLPATLQLGLAALLIGLAVGIPMGIIAATHHGGLVDNLTMFVALFGQAMPVFWLGLMLMLIFAVQIKLFPVSGRGSLRHLVLPAITLSSFSMAQNARMVRSMMLEVLGQDYIRTARAKGISERRVVYVHALKNAMIPVTTLIGIEVGYLLGGAVITETIFSWPGMGRMVVQAVLSKDIPLVQASVIVLALIFVMVNLAVDLTYAYLDPRIRLGERTN